MPLGTLPLTYQTKSPLERQSPMDAMTMASPSVLATRLSPRKRKLEQAMDPADDRQQLIRAASPPSAIG